MDKYEKYIKEMAQTPVVQGITTSIVANELGARAILKILMDKGIVTNEEWINAIQFYTERFVDLHASDAYDDPYEPDFIDFTPDDE